MTRRVITDQWHDHTEEPVIVWVYDGAWELEPVAVDDSHENDLYQEYACAFFAARAYQTFDEVCEEWHEDYTPEQIDELYSRGDCSAERKGLPDMWYAEGTEEDGSDSIIYVDEATYSSSRREALADAAAYLDPEDVADIYRAILAAREEC